MASSKRMRIAWLGGYRLGLLQPELAIVRRLQGHPASWIVNLAKALSTKDDIDLHIITASAGIRKNQTITKDGITFHVIRNTFPFTTRGFPEYMPLDVLTRYASLRRQVRKVILKLQPDLIHVHGPNTAMGWLLWISACQQSFPSRALCNCAPVFLRRSSSDSRRQLNCI